MSQRALYCNSSTVLNSLQICTPEHNENSDWIIVFLNKVLLLVKLLVAEMLIYETASTEVCNTKKSLLIFFVRDFQVICIVL